jgi:ornithine cyclodeaminase/alanine dehydrogenase-like protein (mu-crystallin family)
MKMLVLAEEEVRSIAKIRDVNDLVEECFRALALGLGRNFESVRIHPRDSADRCVIKSGYLHERKALGIKVTRTYPDNPEHHKFPAVNSQIMLLDSETGPSSER